MQPSNWIMKYETPIFGVKIKNIWNHLLPSFADRIHAGMTSMLLNTGRINPHHEIAKHSLREWERGKRSQDVLASPPVADERPKWCHLSPSSFLDSKVTDNTGTGMRYSRSVALKALLELSDCWLSREPSTSWWIPVTPLVLPRTTAWLRALAMTAEKLLHRTLVLRLRTSSHARRLDTCTKKNIPMSRRKQTKWNTWQLILLEHKFGENVPAGGTLLGMLFFFTVGCVSISLGSGVLLQVAVQAPNTRHLVTHLCSLESWQIYKPLWVKNKGLFGQPQQNFLLEFVVKPFGSGVAASCCSGPKQKTPCYSLMLSRVMTDLNPFGTKTKDCLVNRCKTVPANRLPLRCSHQECLKKNKMQLSEPPQIRHPRTLLRHRASTDSSPSDSSAPSSSETAIGVCGGGGSKRRCFRNSANGSPRAPPVSS